jgi:glucosamine 6-phosphate synthetase-like amidotransferase/phosphosugar isomerase protein
MACYSLPPRLASPTPSPHWMLQEIGEQSHSLRETIRRHVSGTVIFPTALNSIEHGLATFQKIIIAASGSSRHAGLVGEIMLENLAGTAVDVEYSGEYWSRRHWRLRWFRLRACGFNGSGDQKYQAIGFRVGRALRNF